MKSVLTARSASASASASFMALLDSDTSVNYINDNLKWNFIRKTSGAYRKFNRVVERKGKPVFSTSFAMQEKKIKNLSGQCSMKAIQMCLWRDIAAPSLSHTYN